MRAIAILAIFSVLHSSCKKDNVGTIITTPPVIQYVIPYTDGPGAPVMIIGTGFGTVVGQLTVSFNGTVATIISVNDTVIQVTVPAGGTDGKITVTVKSEKATSPADFIYLKGVWVKKTSLTAPGDYRLGSSGFSINGKGYVAFGNAYRSSSDTALSDLYEFDPQSDAWTRKSDIPSFGRENAAAAVVGGKAYLIGGAVEDRVGKSVWMYEPTLDRWTRKSDFPGSSRLAMIAFVINDKIYCGAGEDLHNNYREWWQYDPALDGWTQKTDYPGVMPRGGVGLSIGDKGYLGTGVNSNDWWQYDPTKDQWTSKSTIPVTIKYSSGAFVIGTKGYIVAGITSTTWEYDQATDHWTQKTSFYQPRSVGYSFSLGGLGYFGMGLNPDAGSNDKHLDCWSFDPQ